MTQISQNHLNHEKKKENQRKTLKTLSMGVGLRIFGSIVRTPFDTVKQNLQIQRRSKLMNIPNLQSGVLSADQMAYFLYEHNALFSGVKPTLMRDIPFMSVYFLTYEFTKNLLRKKLVNPVIDLESSHFTGKGDRFAKETAKTMVNMISGSVAGVLGEDFFCFSFKNFSNLLKFLHQKRQHTHNSI